VRKLWPEKYALYCERWLAKRERARRCERRKMESRRVRSKAERIPKACHPLTYRLA